MIDSAPNFGIAKFGEYRPMHWWMRSFLQPFGKRAAEYATASKSGEDGGNGGSGDTVLQLSQVAALYRAGELTLAEYRQAKARVLAGESPDHSARNTSREASSSVQLPRFPRHISWPRKFQFAVPRAAVRLRSQYWWRLNAELTAMPSPLKEMMPRAKGDATPKEKKDSARNAKWANFGPYAVDLGPLAPPRIGAIDNRVGANGFFLSAAFERLWFRVFDPAIDEKLPEYPECFEGTSLVVSPVRCSGAACPFQYKRERLDMPPRPPGCAVTDSHKLTAPPNPWLIGSQMGRCLARGCVVFPYGEQAMGQTLFHEWRAHQWLGTPLKLVGVKLPPSKPTRRSDRPKASAGADE